MHFSPARPASLAWLGLALGALACGSGGGDAATPIQPGPSLGGAAQAGTSSAASGGPTSSGAGGMATPVTMGGSGGADAGGTTSAGAAGTLPSGGSGGGVAGSNTGGGGGGGGTSDDAGDTESGKYFHKRTSVQPLLFIRGRRFLLSQFPCSRFLCFHQSLLRSLSAFQ